MTKNSVCCTSYLRNHASYNCNWCYTCVKWLYLQVVFPFYQNFSFLCCWGVKGQKIVQNDKKFCLPRCMSQESGIVWLSFSVHKCKTMIYPQFFKIMIFQVVSGVKGLKMTQNDKKLSLSCSISQKPYISFVGHKCKMIPPDLFFSLFQNFDFGCLWGKRAKIGPKWQNILFLVLLISGTDHHIFISSGIHHHIFRCFFTFFNFQYLC